jgi:NAD(P)-dependent dehydrogenase (short-subunit alcohol dehydrogenase family)
MGNPSVFNLEGKVAIVTGAAQGIGRELALGLGRAGVKLAVVDANLSGAQKVAGEVGALGTSSTAVKADVTQSGELAEMVQAVVKEFGAIDILVNCAGVNSQAPAEDFEEETWNKVIGINLTGTFLVNQAVARQMIKQGGGNIINISSFCSIANVTDNFQSAYYASKAGVAMLSKALAVEWTKYNIRVNAIGPGFTATPMFQADRDALKDADVLLDTVPMGRFQDPKELVGVVIFLASDASSYVTGHELFSDGGRTCM